MIMMTLDMCSGICWSCVYVLAIIAGVRRKTWCIPQLSICLNFSWEFWVVVSRMEEGSELSVAFLIQIVWLLLDVGILLSWLWYAPCNMKNRLKQFALLTATMSLFGYGVYRFGGWELSAFVINLIMSGGFICRLRFPEQSWVVWTIAPLKLIGTLAATILNGILMKNGVIMWIGGLCLILDGYYWMLITKKWTKMAVYKKT